MTTIAKFSDPDVTAKNEPRARVGFSGLETLWINTGTLCNIQCKNCYIESSPTNDNLVYIRKGDVARYLDEAETLNARQIGFTGGEPFMNPDFLNMLEDALERGFDVLVLTNAMRPSMRAPIQQEMLRLNEKFKSTLTLRVSLDHFSKSGHDDERGEGSFEIACEGIRWFCENGFTVSIAGRNIDGDEIGKSETQYSNLMRDLGIDTENLLEDQLVVFPEIAANDDPPEITTSCWKILDVKPSAMMCSNSRMVVHRKGEDAPAVVACTLLPYHKDFDYGSSLTSALNPVKLNHRFCANFCVLGGSSCS